MSSLLSGQQLHNGCSESKPGQSGKPAMIRNFVHLLEADRVRQCKQERGKEVKNHTIYKREEGRRKLTAYYENYLDTFEEKFERVYVPTRAGNTHVLVTGPKEGKPLFILQGGNCISPVTLSWFSGLLKDYRVFAPDTLGHPGHSEEVRMSAKDDSFAWWISDLMEFFQTDKPAFIGPSYGGGIVLRLAAFMPEKIACAVLVAPAGIKLGPKKEMIRKILLPLLLHNQSGSAKALQKIADEMSAGSMEEKDKQIIGEIFRSVKLEQEMPKIVTKKELKGYLAPTLLIAGEKDIFFPGEAVISQAAKVMPSLTEVHLYQSGHFPSKSNISSMEKDIGDFLERHYGRIKRCVR